MLFYFCFQTNISLKSIYIFIFKGKVQTHFQLLLLSALVFVIFTIKSLDQLQNVTAAITYKNKFKQKTRKQNSDTPTVFLVFEWSCI